KAPVKIGVVKDKVGGFEAYRGVGGLDCCVGGPPSIFSGLYGGARGFTGVVEGEAKGEQAHDTGKELPPAYADHFGSGVRHGSLGYEIGILTILGGLAAGAAGFFGAPLALDGRTSALRRRGRLIVAGGVLGCCALWSYGLYGSP